MAYGRRIWAERSYFRLLNRMLLRLAHRNEGIRSCSDSIISTLGLIQRFYAGRLNAVDRIRIVLGKPPVPLTAALACLSEANAQLDETLVPI